MDPSFWPLPSAPSPSGLSISFRGCHNPFQPYLVHDKLWSLIVGYVWVCQFDSHIAMMQRISVILWDVSKSGKSDQKFADHFWLSASQEKTNPRFLIFLKETTLVRGPLEAMSISEKTEARTSDLPGNKSESRVRRSDHLPQWSNLPCTRCMQRKSHDVSMQTWLQYVCSRSHTTDRTSGWTRTCQMP